MSDRHTLSADYQIAQARVVKRLKAENSRLRAALNEERDRLKAMRVIRLPRLFPDACRTEAIQGFNTGVRAVVAILTGEGFDVRMRD
jgi:hypothetical protein